MTYQPAMPIHPHVQDVKTLRRDVKITFPDLSEDDLDQLLPAKTEVQLLKLKNKATAYTCGSADPLFFDPEGRGDLLVPTVYALWRCPHMLDKLHTYSEVSPKVKAHPILCMHITPYHSRRLAVRVHLMHVLVQVDTVGHIAPL